MREGGETHWRTTYKTTKGVMYRRKGCARAAYCILKGGCLQRVRTGVFQLWMQIFEKLVYVYIFYYYYHLYH